MARVKLQGKIRHRIKSYLAISRISILVLGRRLIGNPVEKNWSVMFEIGVLFWRHQFNCAFSASEFQDGRDYFDSLVTDTGIDFPVTEHRAEPNQPRGNWYRFNGKKANIKALYLHGGGYAFRSEISAIFARTFSGLLGVDLFMPEYRLTPEHPHPAQLNDALTAYRYMIDTGLNPEDIFLIGDSAGGHLVLMLLQALKAEGLPQPALAIGLCPWTDIGERGASLFENDKYDLVQGYMAVKFGEWLQGNTDYTREELSPIHQNYKGLAPLYLQAGGREVLVDMIRDFADAVKKQGCEITLDIWPHMTHNFQGHGQTHPNSAEAFVRMGEAIQAYVEGGAAMKVCSRTEISNLKNRV